MKFTAITDIGSVRKNNEDCYYIPVSNGPFILADGMGGHLAGERASGIAVETIAKIFDGANINSKEELVELMVKSAKEANREIYIHSDEESSRGMGTTLTMAYVYEDILYYVNIGDSRIYEIDEDIVQLSKDDSFVNYLIDMGEITEEEALVHPKRNVLTKALGTSENLEVEVGQVSAKVGKKFLLCSDGLTNMVKNEEIRDIVKDNELENAAELLLDKAISNGGIDNITIIIIEI